MREEAGCRDEQDGLGRQGVAIHDVADLEERGRCTTGKDMENGKRGRDTGINVEPTNRKERKSKLMQIHLEKRKTRAL